MGGTIVQRLPGMHHLFNEGGNAREVVGGALEAVEALPSPADSSGEAGGGVVGRAQLARPWCCSFHAHQGPPWRGEGVLIEVARQLGDGGVNRVSSLGGGRVGGVVTRGRLSRRGRGDRILHGVRVAEGVLPRGACEGKTLKHSGRRLG